MYHYVRPAPADLPYFRYLHVDDFRRQLDHLMATDRVVGRDEFLAAVADGHAPGDGLVLTFDDGFADHHDYVLPELVRRGIWGIFYVPTAMYASGKLLDVHRIHLLLGKAGGAAMMDHLLRMLTDDMLSHLHVAEFRNVTYSRQDNDAATTHFKRVLNYYVSYQWRETLLDRLMLETFGDEVALAGEYYMNPSELRALQEAGMVIGSHGVNHLVMSKLTAAEQQHEIAESFRFLGEAVGRIPVRTFCYPYGGFHSFTAETERLLTESGCRFSFNVEPREIAARDLAERPQALPRFDCNSLPFGKASMGSQRAAQ
jgi:peptidoglycan/xylan/chitin deacetylase (PgdA/CDA1 family)